MTPESPRRNNAVPIAIGILGILLEVATLTLMASNRLATSTGTPLIIAGMLLAFVPVFVLARRARRR